MRFAAVTALFLPAMVYGMAIETRQTPKQDDICSWGPPYATAPKECTDRNGGYMFCLAGEQWCGSWLNTGRGGFSMGPLMTRCEEEEFEQCITSTTSAAPAATPTA